MRTQRRAGQIWQNEPNAAECFPTDADVRLVGKSGYRPAPACAVFSLSECPMKTTVEVSDDLYRRAKSEAALRGRKLKDLVEEGLRLVLETPRGTRRRRTLA